MQSPSPPPFAPARIETDAGGGIRVGGHWTALALDEVGRRGPLRAASNTASQATVDASRVEALDSVGAWTLRRLLDAPAGRAAGDAQPRLHGLREALLPVWDSTRGETAATDGAAAGAPPGEGPLARLGRASVARLHDGAAWLDFLGQAACALARCIVQPGRMRWRPILFHVRTAGFDALPIVGLLSFLLGVVVAYQAAAQLRRYGASIFVADLVGLSMLREFAPLMTAIIVAGRSGSAYAAQIGTMAVTEEIDAMRTMAIPPQEQLVVPKLVALVLALPLLTMFADVAGVIGGMVMAKLQLGVDYGDFLARLSRAVTPTTLWIGIGKAPVFAAVIVVVGCYQGLRTRGGADSVGRQTTRSVVQAIFLVIVADALFSVAFSILGL